MQKNRLYESIMQNVSKSVKKVLENIDIPENEESALDFEINDTIEMVLAQLETDGGAYLDWGIINDMYKNVNSKKIADIVGEKFQNKGYYVYYQGMGLGSKAIEPGTPITLRIEKRPHKLSKYDSEFLTYEY